jgi:hypothetical protein
LSNAKFIFPHNTPTTKEAYYYGWSSRGSSHRWVELI